MADRIIDVSTFNGDVDYNKVKAAGIKGVIIRAGFTGYGVSHTKNRDAYFESNYKKAKVAGLNVGAYYYSCALSEDDAVEEAAFFRSLLSGKTFEMPVYMDVEETHSTSNMPALGKAKLTAVVTKFCSEMEAAGYFAGFYTGKSWAENYLDMNKLSRFTFWLAHWVARTTYNGKFAMWQYTETGKVSGIAHAFDMSYCYEDFPAIIKAAGLNGFPKPKKVIPGDVNGDGKVTVEDSRTVLRAAIGLEKLTEEQKKAADINGDGKVDVTDAREVLRRSIGLD